MGDFITGALLGIILFFGVIKGLVQIKKDYDNYHSK